mmetsp:Transcript_21102/g.44527  ORF Transcript_21102/g.44527 Transcript_21102/m.44527 type:complete len:204 (-) Transcript_21102:560-1171(-)
MPRPRERMGAQSVVTYRSIVRRCLWRWFGTGGMVWMSMSWGLVVVVCGASILLSNLLELGIASVFAVSVMLFIGPSPSRFFMSSSENVVDSSSSSFPLSSWLSLSMLRLFSTSLFRSCPDESASIDSPNSVGHTNSSSLSLLFFFLSSSSRFINSSLSLLMGPVIFRGKRTILPSSLYLNLTKFFRAKSATMAIKISSGNFFL